MSSTEVKIKVLIPIKHGGYTGQRDAWEEYTRDYAVSVDGDTVTLKSCDSIQRSLTFSKRDFDAALRALNMHSVTYRGVDSNSFKMPTLPETYDG